MNAYDIIIVGSGLGGLECGAILSKEGYHVCVLEKNEQLGGCFQTYRRKGKLLDTGIHYIGSMDEGQILNQCFRYFGIMDKLHVRRMDTDVFDRIYFQGKEYNYAMGHENFVESLSQSFPKERNNLERYVELIRKVGSLISIDNLKEGIISKRGLQYFSMSAVHALEEITSNHDLQQILAGTALLHGGIKEQSTFYHHGMINNSYIESAYRFVKGSMQVSTELAQVICNNGGTVRNNSEVTRVIVEDEQVKGVVVNNEEVLESKYVISNVHPKRTFELTDKSRKIRNAYLSRINSLENTYGVFTAYLIMKKDCYPYLNYNIYLHGANDVWYCRERDTGAINSCMISMQTPELNGKHAEVVSLLIPMYMDELLEWKDTLPEQRGDSYRAFKQAKVEQILAFCKRHGYSFDGCIDSIYTTTPLSYRDYTATIDGSAYGIMKDYKCPQVGFISAKTKLGNLLLTGQNLNVHGALGVTLSAMITCAELIGEEYLAQKVGYA